MAKRVDPTTALAEAQRALAADDEGAALSGLLEAWRALRAPQIAALIDTLGRRLEPHAGGKVTGKRDEVHASWMAMVEQATPVHWPAILRSIILTADRFGVAAIQALDERADRVLRWPADPRTAALVVEHLRRPGYESSSSSTQPFWSKLLALVVDHDDGRAAALLAKLSYSSIFSSYSDRSRARTWFQQAVDTTVVALRKRSAPPEPSKPLIDACAKFAKALAKRGPVSAAQIALLQIRVAAKPAPAPKAKPKKVPAIDPSSAGAHLEAAVRALDDGKDEAALEALLQAWRACRAPQLAALVETLSTRLGAQLPPITGTTRKAIHTTWLATAARRRSLDLPRLLASIANTMFRSTDAHARVKALEPWPHDPRTGTGVVRQLEDPVFNTSSTKPFWTALVRLAADHGDPRTIVAFESLADRYKKVLVSKYSDMTPMIRWFQRELRAAAAELRGRFPTMPEASSPVVARIAAKLQSGALTDECLLDEIAEHPDDEHPRQVYADHLIERDDPRGELIMLQLSGSDPKREQKLLEQHARTWLGPLAPLVNDWRHYRFARGFPVEIQLCDPTPTALERSIGDRAWSTVNRLTLFSDDPLPVTLLRHPAMRSLQHLGGLTRETLRELLTWKTVPYATLNVVIADSSFDESAGHANLESLESGEPKLPQLRALELDAGSIEPHDLRWIWKSWIGRQLECFGADGGLAELPAWISEIDKHAKNLRVVKLSKDSIWREWVELTRDGKGKFSRAEVRTWDPSHRFPTITPVLPAILSNLPRGALTRLRFVGGAPMPRQLAAIKDACLAAKIALELPTASR